MSVNLVLGAKIESVKERFTYGDPDFPDCQGLVLLNSGIAIELSFHAPASDSLQLVTYPIDALSSKDLYDSPHSLHCVGKSVVDIFRTFYSPYLGVVLDDESAVYMDSDFGDGLRVFRQRLLGWYVDDAISLITNMPIR